MRSVRIVLAFALVAATVAPAHAFPEPRQYYGKSWAYNNAKKYYYREYHYKKKATDTTYQKQYLIYYKSDPKKKN